MRTMVMLLSMLPGAAAQTGADRREILEVVAWLNEHLADEDSPPEAGRYFTSDADVWTRSGRSTIAALWKRSRPPWSETTAPRITGETIRYLAPVVALLDAEVVQFGSMIGKRSIPLLLILQKENGQWRVASLRLSAGPPAGIFASGEPPPR